MQELAPLPHWKRDLLTDPQTSGGLLIACSPAVAEGVLAAARARGFKEPPPRSAASPAARWASSPGFASC